MQTPAHIANNTPAVVRRVQRAVDVGQQLENDAEVFARLRADVGEQRPLQYRVLSQQVAARYEMTVPRQNKHMTSVNQSRHTKGLCYAKYQRPSLNSQHKEPKFLT